MGGLFLNGINRKYLCLMGHHLPGLIYRISGGKKVSKQEF